MDRKITLLKACMELLEKQEQSGVVLNLLEESIHYDDVESDGSGLLEDIKEYLEALEENK